MNTCQKEYEILIEIYFPFLQKPRAAPRTHSRTAHTPAHTPARAHFPAQKNTPKPDRKIHLLKGPRHPEKHPKTGQGLQNLARAQIWPPGTPPGTPPKKALFGARTLGTGPLSGERDLPGGSPGDPPGDPPRGPPPKMAQNGPFWPPRGTPPKTAFLGISGKSGGRARARGFPGGEIWEIRAARISPADISRSIL